MRPLTRPLPLSVLAFTVLASLPFAACAAGEGSATADAAYGTENGAPGVAQMPANPAFLKSGESRTFAIEYTAQVKDVPAGSKVLRVWVPVPQDTPVQTIRELKFHGAQPTITTEKKFGNKLAYWEIANPPANVETKYSFTCTRKEQVTDLQATATDGKETEAIPAAFTGNDKLTYVDANIRKIAAEVTAGKTTALAKSRAIYDYVLGHMKYDKSGKGWGHGDVKHACDVGEGNCTDFHALFMALARASGVPSGFEIGLYLPYERGKQEEPGGYHCWSFFRVPGKTWVPIDASEADRFPERAEYFFGAHTPNRVTLAVGRDLVLEPKQQGEPRNYLLNPYAEVDGKSATTAKTWTYKDL